jgi:hypothetical protein
MAQTSTNKLPLLIDRPLLRVVPLLATTSPATPEPGTGSNGVLLCDCIDNDGAILDTIFLIQRVAATTGFCNLYLSSSNTALGLSASGGVADAQFLGRISLDGSLPVGSFVPWVAPAILGPVPHSGENIGNRPPQFDALLVPSGMAIWAAWGSAAPDPNAPNIAAQGGWY